MKSTQYSEKVLDHFKNPRNVGTLSGPDVASGRVGNPTCGDIMEIYIKVNDEVIEDIKFKTFGCGSAVATSSMITTMVRGMKIEDALKVSKQDVANELDGLPPVKMHCSNLAADALEEAVKNYRQGDRVDVSEEEAKLASTPVIGELEYLGKGLDYSLQNPDDYKDQRVLILHKDDRAIEWALSLTEYTNRVVLVTHSKRINTTKELKNKLRSSDVKLLTESRILQISGEGEVEKANILNLDEDEKYDLFVDRVIIPETMVVVTDCEDSD